ncbi:hypothetical protein CAPTEDRAFT_197082 [Capitella teleta]|uniref:RNase H type-1 domain-containing protein n=1 Tax=Capitella teleta TaxID=283909 RepID=R7VGW3_CAPTE|nr:hypothetical protein CAPTEDRAFT_197082 [Capitella teleta]|eukprot:ELU18078.1 hypothetical protein CAPTEDRAFT_197082 [Capitella teleta]
MDKSPDHKVILIDGSKSDSAVACSATADNLQIRLPDSASIFSAELLAIYKVLTLLECSASSSSSTDSLLSLQGIGNFNIKHPYVVKILEKCTLLHKKGIDLVMTWCPSHVGVMGNERADLLAKEALSFTTCTIRIPSSDFKPITHEFYKEKWQEQWSSEQENKLYCIQPTLGKWAKSSREIRREEIVLARARIGHSHLTHGYLLRREMPPVCIPCQNILSIKHIFIECVDFDILLRRLIALSNCDITHHYLLSILNKQNNLDRKGKLVVFIWCPSYVGILGNEVADRLAKQALVMPVTKLPLPHTDYKSPIRSYVKSLWQNERDEETDNKLHTIQPIMEMNEEGPSFHLAEAVGSFKDQSSTSGCESSLESANDSNPTTAVITDISSVSPMIDVNTVENP